MYEDVMRKFEGKHKKKELVEILLKHGYSVDAKKEKIVTNGLSIADTEFEEVYDIDRRVVSETVDRILEDRELQDIFEKMHSISSLEKVAPDIGLSVVTISVEESSSPGLLAEMTQVFADYKINVRQAIAEDPYFSHQAKFIVIIEGKLPGEACNELQNIKFVTDIAHTVPM